MNWVAAMPPACWAIWAIDFLSIFLVGCRIFYIFAPDKMMCGEAEGLFFVAIQLLIGNKYLLLYD